MTAMTCPCRNKPAEEAVTDAKRDRYVSFIGLECDAKAATLMQRIRDYIDDPQHSNVFWEYFKKKAAGGSGPRPDPLFLIHSNLNQIRELFEDKGDEDALRLLDNIEEECC
ncbi:N(2)-fixation sustaining protein CowN [Rhodocyclus tenuis]|uniref:N(2)-fixation sustaining protein CowN n=1 Tax=Rhodocyclus tenuis TaxID=1066 RepID=A0A840G9U3_RHOTE|nr:N(2)-fixation sustaining protein CowN [Rhodocyclus tenuis]MBB4247448.1 hypothetical protein [Rhodocyclus tenuis]